jgi:transposase-like protein
MTSHLGYDKHSISGSNTGNSRNGHSSKTIRTDSGNFNLTIPRDRNGDFAAKIITKNSKTIGKLDKQVISLYAKGLSTRDIQEQLEDIYGTEVSPQFISNVTDGVMDDVVAWRNRPLDPIYPIIYMDCIVVKIKENKQITNHAIYFALGVNMNGQKELLGMWVSQNEGAKFWLHVLT